MTDKELYQQMLHFIECSGYRAEPIKKELKIRLAQPEKEWAGLTDKEVVILAYQSQENECTAIRLAEQALKEKNT